MIPSINSTIGSGSGKANATFRWLAENTDKLDSPGKVETHLYVTGRSEIETLDFSRFVATFGPHLSRPKLRRLHGSVHFAVDGYDGTELDLFEIEEVRRFYRLLHAFWPCWLFAGSVHSSNLRTITLCILPNLTLKRTSDECRISLPQEDLATFLESCLPVSAILHHRAGMSKRSGVQHLKAVERYLGIS